MRDGKSDDKLLLGTWVAKEPIENCRKIFNLVRSRHVEHNKSYSQVHGESDLLFDDGLRSPSYMLIRAITLGKVRVDFANDVLLPPTRLDASI